MGLEVQRLHIDYRISNGNDQELTSNYPGPRSFPEGKLLRNLLVVLDAGFDLARAIDLPVAG